MERDRHKELWRVLPVLHGDYTDYGGDVERWANDTQAYPDCSCGCKWAAYLEGSGDWLVCGNPIGYRKGLLTREHQTGWCCYEAEEEEENTDGPAGRA